MHTQLMPRAVLHTAPAVRTCSWQMPAMVPPSSMRNTPAATAPPALPARSPAAARCVATRDEEQAVCVARHGPADATSVQQQRRCRVQPSTDPRTAPV